MFSKALHNRWARLGMGILGVLLMAISINLFVVPHNLYTGGLLGFCQLFRSILTQRLGVEPGFDISGVLYLLLNIPLLILAWKTMGRGFVVRTMTCTVCCSLFLTMIPVPAHPIVEDTLTSCLLGGMVNGFAGGIVLTCGCSSGGFDILGLYMSKKGKGFTVGKFSISCNAVLYALCLVLFDAATAIYSTIYTVFNSLFLDRTHQQSITVQVLIFTREKHTELPFDKITVAALVKRAGVSPNTFYYHYEDIYALLDAWFRQVVEFYAPADSFLEWKSATKAVLHRCKDHPKVIYHIFDGLSRDRLERYIFSLTDDVFYRLARQAARGQELPEERVRSVASFCRYAYIGFVMQFFWNRMENDIDTSVDRLADLFDSFLASAVQVEA